MIIHDRHDKITNCDIEGELIKNNIHGIRTFLRIAASL